MLFEELKEGQILTIKRNKGKTKVCDGSVISFNQDKRTIELNVPRWSNIFNRLLWYSQCVVLSETKENLRKIAVKGVKTHKNNSVYTVTFKVLGEDVIFGKKRRKFTYSTPMHYIVDNSNDHDSKQNYARTNNISVDGLSFRTNIEHQVGDKIKGYIELDDENVPFICEITGETDSITEDFSYHYPAKFINICPEYQDIIVKFIFKTERESLRKQFEN